MTTISWATAAVVVVTATVKVEVARGVVAVQKEAAQKEAAKKEAAR